MKKIHLIPVLALLLILCGCTNEKHAQVVATTKPVYEFTGYICRNTDIAVQLLVTEEVSCLHDYSLQVSQMRAIENAEMIVINGAGLEAFLDDVLPANAAQVNCAEDITLSCPTEHDHDDHKHDEDPHFWLDVTSAKIMARNICSGLSEKYPQWKDTFCQNEAQLLAELDALYKYGCQELSQINSREMITFHDGFSYFAQSFDLTILAAVEEESGSEASAAELIQLINIVKDHKLPAIFTETSGSTSAAQIIANETGASIYTLDMGMSDKGYFDTMYHNINTVKEALK